MRVLRAKSVRKYLKFYKLVFGIDAPYSVILDGNFIFTAMKYKIDVRDRLEKLLQGGEVKLFVLKSVIKELEAVGPKAKSAKDFATTYCELIDDDQISGEVPSERLTKYIEKLYGDQKLGSKKKRYFVATQDQDLRRVLGQTPGVPLIYLNLVTLVLESPSQSSQNYNRNLEVSKTDLNEEETNMLTDLSSKKKRKRQSAEGDEEEAASAGPSESARKDSKSAGGLTAASSSGTSKFTTALPPGVAVVSRKKHKANAPNPLSNAKPDADSNNSKKKKERKFRKFY